MVKKQLGVRKSEPRTLFSGRFYTYKRHILQPQKNEAIKNSVEIHVLVLSHLEELEFFDILFFIFKKKKKKKKRCIISH